MALAGVWTNEWVRPQLLIVRVAALKWDPDRFKASLQARIGPAAWVKSQMRCKSSQGKAPAKRAFLKESHGAVTDTAVGSARHGTKSSNTNSLAHRAVDLHSAARAAETSVERAVAERGGRGPIHGSRNTASGHKVAAPFQREAENRGPPQFS